MTVDGSNSETLSHQEKIHQIIRVNQAGEQGAVQIYKGQLWALKDQSIRETLEHMLTQEENHLSQFNKQIVKHRVRPTLLSPLWHGAGFALGALTGLLGEKAAMACTVAVEEVIDTHYEFQENYLERASQKRDQELKELITHCRQEEQEHRDIGYAHHAEKAMGYTLLTKTVKAASKMAIWLSKRI